MNYYPPSIGSELGHLWYCLLGGAEASTMQDEADLYDDLRLEVESCQRAEPDLAPIRSLLEARAGDFASLRDTGNHGRRMHGHLTQLEELLSSIEPRRD